MAGGKETPRQKMIGMMYLVLTALLALQVSNAVLEKFAIINETLHDLITQQSAKSDEILRTIIAEAGKSQNAKVVSAKERAQKVRDLTKTTVEAIEALKVRMMKTAGSDKVDERVINDHSSKVATMMMDANSPEGKNYEKLLNDYVQQMNELTGMNPKFEKIAKAPAELELFKDDNDHVRKDFLTFTFENTPVIAALASVTQVETEVLEYENRALDHLRAEANIGKISFDQFVPMVRAKASTIAAGSKYEAEMFLTGSSTAILPEFYKDGVKLTVVEDPDTKVKMGKVEFTAVGGGYGPDGTAKKTFLAEIKMNDTTFRKAIEYTVIAPVIRVTTGNAPTLYMNCGNSVNIEVPALGANYNPSFSAGEGAEIIKGDKPGKVTIIPKQRKISVAVSNAGTPIGAQPFDVKNIPDPKYIAYVGSAAVDLRNGIRANQIGTLRFVAEPEANFKEEVPKDARYRIRRAEVILARGTTPVARMNADENPDLRQWINQARPGDAIVIDVKEVIRRTYKDGEEKVDVKGSTGIIRIPII